MTYDELAAYCKEANNEIIRQDEQIRKLEKENQELKNQLEETRKCLKDMYHINIENDKELDKLKTQQKKFIKYLDDMLDDENDIFSVVRVKDVLSKYKEIAGESDDKTN